jgi:hypothetical protein
MAVKRKFGRHKFLERGTHKNRGGFSFGFQGRRSLVLQEMSDSGHEGDDGDEPSVGSIDPEAESLQGERPEERMTM